MRMRMWFWKAILPLVALMVFVMPSVGQAADVLSGRYVGVEDAAGASIVISPDSEGFRGTFYDAQGLSQDFEADKIGDTAEAVLDFVNTPATAVDGSNNAKSRSVRPA